LTDPLVDAALDIAVASARVANYCDHAEHNEIVDRDWVLGPARDLLRVAVNLGEQFGVDPWQAYARRLAQIELANPLRSETSFDGSSALEQARTWREVQSVQANHDRHYHPDVAGLSRAEQLRHYAFHVAKIAGALAMSAKGELEQDEIRDRRLPDTVLFGVKLHTAMGVHLPDLGREVQLPAE
jgi:hypothetical protein